MRRFFRKLSEKCGRGLASVISFLFLFSIVVMAGLQGFAFWLNSDRGEAWLSGQIATLMEATPYRMTLDRFELNGFLGLGAQKVTLADSDGVFLTLDGVGMDIDLLPLALKRARLNIDAKTARLQRLPAAQEDTTGNDPAFLMPARIDIFFNVVTLDVDIDTLRLEDAVIDGGLSVAIEAKQSFTLGAENIEWAGRIDITDAKGAAQAYLPEKISYNIKAPWGGADITIPSFEAERAKAYRVTAGGLYHPDGNKVGLDIKGAIDQAFHPDITKDIEMTARIDGTPEAYDGDIKAAGEIRGQPLSVSAAINGSPQKITVGEISGAMISTAIEGDVALFPENEYKTKGYLKATFESLDLVNSFTQMQVSGRGGVTLNLDIEKGVQIFSGTGNFENIALGEMRINHLDWRARPQEENGIVDITFNLDGFDEQPFDITGQIAADMQSKTADIHDLTLKSQGGEIKASGLISNNALDGHIVYKDIHPNRLPFITLGSRVPLVLQQGRVDISGTPSAPIVTASGKAVPRMRRAQDIVLSFDATYESGMVDMEAALSKSGQAALNAAAGFPARISFLPFETAFAADAPLDGGITGDMNMADMLDPFLGDEQALSGRLQLDARLSGQLSAPMLDGQMRLADGAYVNEAHGVNLQDINGQIQMAGKQMTVTRLTATDGRQGRVNVTGGIDVSQGFPPVVNMDIKADKMRFLNTGDIRADLDATLGVTTHDGIYTVSGTVTPNEFLYTLPEHFNTSIPELNIVTDTAKESTPLLEILRLDMAFDAAHRIVIRGWGLDVQLGGKLEIAGTAAAPDVRGALSVVRGNYEEFGRRFELAESYLTFQGPIPPSPYLDITAAAEIEDYTTYVYIRGPANDPNLSFGATPSMPEDEVLAYILFGKNINQISPFQALQLANTLHRFSGGGGGLDPISELQQATGLDDLRIEGGTGEGVSVGAGKYLSDDVYLEVKQGAEEGSGGARVEVELTPRITIESEVSSRGETGGGIFWEWDY